MPNILLQIFFTHWQLLLGKEVKNNSFNRLQKMKGYFILKNNLRKEKH